MLRRVLVKAKLLAQRDGHAVKVLRADLAAAVRTDELHRARDAAGLDGRLQLGRHLDRLVDGVLCHLAVGRPLSAGDRDELAVDDIDDVVARQLLRVVGVRLWVAHERADARPRGAHRRVVDGIAHHPVDLGDDEVDLGEGRARLEGDLALRVRRARDRRALPRQQVEDAPVLGEPHHPHLVGRAVVGEDEVRARRGHHDLLARRVGHLAHLVGEDATRVDHLLCAHVIDLVGEDVAHLGAAHLVVGRAGRAAGEQVEHLCVVLHGRARLDRRERDAQVHARVVLLAVVNDEAALERVAVGVLRLHRRELEERLVARDEMAGRHRAPLACDDIVQLAREVHHRHLPPLEERHHHRDRVRHEWRRLDHVGALGEVGGNDLHVLVVVLQVPNDVEQRVGRDLGLEGLCEVPDAAVDQLG
mmetsp:Transcript_7542/g.23849  ORF Transcript_7542/g.23849 Transcript_7542/m.23849 type:complete len:417 (-) Transcript_7542:382-1632(-)